MNTPRLHSTIMLIVFYMSIVMLHLQGLVYRFIVTIAVLLFKSFANVGLITYSFMSAVLFFYVDLFMTHYLFILLSYLKKENAT